MRRWLLLAFVVGVVVGVHCQTLSPARLTLGTIAQKTVDLRDQRVVVSNVVGGVRHDRFLLIASTVSTRHPVVFAFRDEVEPHGGIVVGYCFGVADQSVPGAPTEPPFVYVFDCR